MAGVAGKAAPAMAIAGVLVTAPQAHAAVGAARAATVVVQAHTAVQARAAVRVTHRQPVTARPAATLSAVDDALVIHHDPARHYMVRAGDTLSSIAQRFYGSAADWHALFEANLSVVHDPNDIFPGQVLDVPYHLTGAAAATTRSQPATTELTSSTSLSGTLGCSQLEELWEQAGGSAGEAVTAASIAMAESSGEQFATGTVGERGYWQINPDHGSLSTYDPVGNAQAAVIISADGTNWAPWTTFTSGAYLGRC